MTLLADDQALNFCKPREERIDPKGDEPEKFIVISMIPVSVTRVHKCHRFFPVDQPIST